MTYLCAGVIVLAVSRANLTYPRVRITGLAGFGKYDLPVFKCHCPGWL
jgi:hypothetical protein